MLDAVFVRLCIFGIIAVLLFLILLLNQAKKAKTAKFKKYSYISAGVICGPLLLAFIAIAFDQFILFILFTLAAFLFSLIMIPFITEQRKIEAAEIMKSIDASKPLSVKDFFSQNFQYKLVKKYRLRKAITIYMAQLTVFVGIGGVTGFLIILLSGVPPFSDIPWWSILLYCLMFFPIFIPISYFQAKGELKDVLQQTQTGYPTSCAPPSTTPITENTTNFCPTCGTPIPPDANFCIQCGKQL